MEGRRIAHLARGLDVLSIPAAAAAIGGALGAWVVLGIVERTMEWERVDPWLAVWSVGSIVWLAIALVRWLVPSAGERPRWTRWWRRSAGVGMALGLLALGVAAG